MGDPYRRRVGLGGASSEGASGNAARRRRNGSAIADGDLVFGPSIQPDPNRPRRFAVSADEDGGIDASGPLKIRTGNGVGVQGGAVTVLAGEIISGHMRLDAGGRIEPRPIAPQDDLAASASTADIITAINSLFAALRAGGLQEG